MADMMTRRQTHVLWARGLVGTFFIYCTRSKLVNRGDSDLQVALITVFNAGGTSENVLPGPEIECG